MSVGFVFFLVAPAMGWREGGGDASTPSRECSPPFTQRGPFVSDSRLMLRFSPKEDSIVSASTADTLQPPSGCHCHSLCPATATATAPLYRPTVGTRTEPSVNVLPPSTPCSPNSKPLSLLSINLRNVCLLKTRSPSSTARSSRCSATGTSLTASRRCWRQGQTGDHDSL